jgi:TolB-like protein
VERTKPLSETEDEEKTFVPNAWKMATYVSFAVIIGLVVLNIMGIGKQVRHGEIRSLLILPFQNYTGDMQLDVFISGMQAALIGDVGRISGLNVISKTTSDVYNDADMTLAQIASELSVDVMVEPAVMHLGDSIFFQLKMISPDEDQLWIAEYRELKNNIPNLHNLVTKQIADEMKIELSADQDRILAKSNSVNPEALDAYFKGLLYLDKIDRKSLIKAGEQFHRAVEVEPAWAPSYAGLAEADAYSMQMSFV